MALTVERRRTILRASLPILGALASQNVMNLVDTWFVGHLGNAALAAVGMGGLVNFVTAALVLGMSVGVQATVARRVGAGQLSEAAVPLNGGLLIVLAGALPITVLLATFAPQLMGLLLDDPAAAALGGSYLRIRVLATAALAMNFSFRAFWSATNRPMLYMITLLSMHVVNIFLDWVLINGHLGLPALGTSGAALAACIAAYLGIAINTLQGLRLARSQGFLQRLPDREGFRSVLRLSIPGGLQQFSFSAGLTAFLWIGNKVSVDAAAAMQVLLSLVFLGIIPGLAFGLGALSLVGQALGRGDVNDAKAWGWDVGKLAMWIVVCVALPAAALPDLMLASFLHDPATLELAIPALRATGFCIITDALGIVLMNALLGAGDNRRVMVVAGAAQWLVGVPAAYIAGPLLGGGFLAVWLAFLGSRQVFALGAVALWTRGQWASIRV